MKTEKEKMLAGELYDPLDAQLSRERQRCRDLLKQLNDSREDQTEERRHILTELFGRATDAWIQPPFYCDYGYNLHLGRKVFFNFNCVVLDVMPVRVGDNVLFGPSVQVYTATHPLRAADRRSWLELEAWLREPFRLMCLPREILVGKFASWNRSLDPSRRLKAGSGREAACRQSLARPSPSELGFAESTWFANPLKKAVKDLA
jgi:hypothetical protein